MANRLWITYAWADNDEGDFDHLVNRLEAGGVPATYDKIALVPGQRLWEQIGAQITEGDIAGWAYLITPRSSASEACREELAYALERALRVRRERFPLLGLLRGVSIEDVPAALRVRLCVDLSSPSWVAEVRAGLERCAPSHPREDTGDVRITVHSPYQSDGRLYALEFRPRFGELRYWRIAYPANLEPTHRGTGPSGAGGVGGTLTEFVEGTVELEGRRMKFFGAGTALTPGTAAYVVFREENPDFVAFSVATGPFQIPARWIPMHLDAPAA